MSPKMEYPRIERSVDNFIGFLKTSMVEQEIEGEFEKKMHDKAYKIKEEKNRLMFYNE